MKPILNAGLPAIGVIQTLIHMVGHGPHLYQGLDIPDLFMEQCITSYRDTAAVWLPSLQYHRNHDQKQCHPKLFMHIPLPCKNQGLWYNNSQAWHTSDKTGYCFWQQSGERFKARALYTLKGTMGSLIPCHGQAEKIGHLHQC